MNVPYSYFKLCTVKSVSAVSLGCDYEISSTLLCWLLSIVDNSSMGCSDWLGSDISLVCLVSETSYGNDVLIGF